MIVETFTHGPGPVYARFHERGRLAPNGLYYVSSVVSADGRRCYQLMECDEPGLLEEWMAAWRDLIQFEVVPVIASSAAIRRFGPMPGTIDSKARFEGAEPILSVRDMAVSVRYYVEVLGFKSADWGTDDFTTVTRDAAGIYLCQGNQGRSGTWAWIGVEDVGLLYDEYQASGAKIRQEPTNYPWAYEMKVEDPDGHVLRFGSQPRADLPLARQPG
ncbi:MAG: DUF3303 family protein [Gemmatimonadaceae bacterium]